MKVALVEPVGGHGGMNYYDFALADGLVAAGVEVVLYTCDKTAVPPGLRFEVRQAFRGIWGDRGKLGRATRFVLGLGRSLGEARRRGTRIVHFHFFHYTAMEALCVALARIARLRIVITAHDVESFAGGHSPAAAAWVLGRADAIIAHSNVGRTEMIEGLRVSAERTVSIPHGNYISAIPGDPSPVEAREALGLAPGAPVLLFFGQIKQVKGLDLLLESLPPVVAKFPDLRLVVAGKVWKDDLSQYTALIKELGLEANVQLNVGYIPDDRVATYFRAADLVVAPYRRIYQSGVVLMAMSYGRPVLASDVSGMREVITDGANGYLFESGNVADLSRRLIAVLSARDAAENVGRRAREFVTANHCWKRIGLETRDVYERAAGGT